MSTDFRFIATIARMQDRLSITMAGHNFDVFSGFGEYVIQAPPAFKVWAGASIFLVSFDQTAKGDRNLATILTLREGVFVLEDADDDPILMPNVVIEAEAAVGSLLFWLAVRSRLTGDTKNVPWTKDRTHVATSALPSTKASLLRPGASTIVTLGLNEFTVFSAGVEAYIVRYTAHDKAKPNGCRPFDLLLQAEPEGVAAKRIAIYPRVGDFYGDDVFHPSWPLHVGDFTDKDAVRYFYFYITSRDMEGEVSSVAITRT